MNSPEALSALYWLIADTFRQALQSRVFWIMLAVSVLCTVFCLGVSVDGVGTTHEDWDLRDGNGQPFTGSNPKPAQLRLLFGAFRLTMHRDAEAEVRLIETIFGSWVAGSVGIVLSLVWTAGFVPEFLQPASAAVLLAKPVPRWLILAGKFSGVVLFIALQATLFFVGTWLALGLRTDVWLNGYLLGVPVFVASFASVYSFSVLLAATFRSTLACVVGVVLFWALCFATNYARHCVAAYPQLTPEGPALPASTALLADIAYWLLPKPADMTILLERLLNASADQATLSSLPEFAHMLRVGAFQPELALLSLVGFCAVMIGLAGYQLAHTDY